MSVARKGADGSLYMTPWAPTEAEFAAYCEREVELCVKAREGRGGMTLRQGWSDLTWDRATLKMSRDRS